MKETRFQFHYAIEGDTVHVLIRAAENPQQHPQALGKLSMPLSVWESFKEMTTMGAAWMMEHKETAHNVIFMDRASAHQHRLAEGEGKFDKKEEPEGLCEVIAHEPAEGENIEDIRCILPKSHYPETPHQFPEGVEVEV